MKILAITDLHANIANPESGSYYVSPSRYFEELAQRAKQVDLIVCSGDISVFGMEIMEVLEQMNSWEKPVFLIHGNHEDPDMLEDMVSQYDNIHFVHGREVDHGGISILGWGGGGFGQEDAKLAKFAKQFSPKANRIILFHGPPHGTTLDWMDAWEDYRGNHTYRAVIEHLQPFLVVVGHIHESIGKQDTIGRSIVINPGPLGKFVELEGLPAVKEPKSAVKKVIAKPIKKKK